MSKDNIRDVKLRVWLANYSVTSTADGCGVTRDAIYQANRDKTRTVFLTVDGDTILNAFEWKDKVNVFGFKG